jgi:glycosyltransferase involved in cell wall biosynthesis
VFLYDHTMKLSIITPTHNRMTLLESALAGLEVQTFQDFEWVVAVDGSTDGTVTMLEAFRRRSSFPVTVIVLAQGGQARARNRAIQAASGDALVFMDDDLAFAPETLARHAAFHEVYPNDIAVGPVTNASDGRVDWPRVPTWMNFTGMNVSVSRLALLKVGLFDESFTGYGGEDLDLGIRLERAGHRFRRLSDAGSTHLAPAARDERKGRLAGEAAQRLALKYGSGVGAMLGVHPAIIALKRVVMNPVGDAILGKNPGYAFERAYIKGARATRAQAEESVQQDLENPSSKEQP